MNFLYFLLIGLAAGWLAGKITKGHSFGLLGNLIIGVIGAFLGGLVFSLFGLGAENLIGEIITATVGAILLLYLIRLIKK